MILPSPFASGAVNVDLDLTVVAHFVLFTAFVVLMKDVLFEPLLRVFEERERRTSGAIDVARSADDRAIELKGELDRRVEDVRREAAVDRDRIRARLKKLEAESVAGALAGVEAKLRAGLTELSGEVDEVERELALERAAVAREIASRVLGREVGS
ncbi:MAG: H(+)-transporting ATPase [Myxococcales bacterium]|nr:H(+)-transporting ATPase [Myxococcales bacterium]